MAGHQQLTAARETTRQPTHLNLNVCRLALSATKGLVDHDAAVGQAVTLALVARGEQEGTHGGGQAHAHGGHVGADVAHRVKHRHSCTRGPCTSNDRSTSSYGAEAGSTHKRGGGHQPKALMLRTCSDRATG